MLKSIIEGPFRTNPGERPGFQTYRHPNGKWYQRRITNRGNNRQPGAKRIRVAIVRKSRKGEDR